ncbi:MAG: phosphohistidine phosphatase SixA [Gammaproteobacteria bacterium]|nr:phosphohistidine phosphatase SixA [Gammaproteobacteria bacterium]
MKLYLIQHGQAVDKKTDPQRPLSEQGKLEVGDVANYFRQSGLHIAHIYHSGKPRAAQTARIFANVLDIAHVEQLNGINPNDPVEPVVEIIEEWTENTMIVGHLPFLPHLVSRLLTGNAPSDADYLPGNIISLESDDHKTWSLAASGTYDSFHH